jgi:hypothetical protein
MIQAIAVFKTRVPHAENSLSIAALECGPYEYDQYHLVGATRGTARRAGSMNEGVQDLFGVLRVTDMALSTFDPAWTVTHVKYPVGMPQELSTVVQIMYNTPRDSLRRTSHHKTLRDYYQKNVSNKPM